MKKRIIYSSLLIALSILSCQDDDGYDDFNVEQTETVALAGEWFVRTYDNTGEVTSSYYTMTTSNTATNTTDLWINDDGTIDVEAIVQTNISALTFSATDTENFDPDDEDIPETVTITNGRIIKNGGITAVTRTTVDSIFFNVIKSTDPLTTFTVAGHKSTGFLEDEL